MTMLRRLAVIVALMSQVAAPAKAQGAGADMDGAIRDYLERHPETVQRIVKDYLLGNPDVMQEVLAEMIRRKTPPAPDRSAAVRDNAAALFTSSRQVTLGNAAGDVTLVEFFDYNCGYCKRALADTLTFLKLDPKLKVVLKELPILGPQSVEAARVAIALRMQDPDGTRYLAFHQRLLAARQADASVALAVAREAGADMARLERDMASPEIDDTIAESRRLATALGITGTPSYVVGGDVVIGAVGFGALTEKIRAARRP
jgi:protein-disulfide isomerase